MARKRVSEKEIVVSAPVPVRHKLATPRSPRRSAATPAAASAPEPLLLPNRLLTWHTPIGKPAATRAVHPKKIGCAPNSNCAFKSPPLNLLLSLSGLFILPQYRQQAALNL
jgi:hypothetical protein